MAMMDVKGYVTAIVTGLVGVVVAANLNCFAMNHGNSEKIAPLLNATTGTGIGILAAPIVGTIVGAFRFRHDISKSNSKESCLSYSDLTSLQW
jgi:uncharacterized membrane protein YeaQ/YmgE (transglycosylase-associated protein family)